MQYNKVPKTDLSVSKVCLGSMTFGTPVAFDDAVKLVEYAVSQGINFIDTANMYEGYARYAGSSGGVAEEIIGKATKSCRKDVVIATKLGMKVGPNPEDEFTSPAAIKKHLDLSLGRLCTDYIDVYYLHKPDPATPVADTLGALADAIKAGKIRYYGVSNYSGAELKNLVKIADENGLPRPVMCQPPLSLLKTDSLDEIIPFCAEEEIGVVPYQVLQGGVLTGKYKKGQPAPARLPQGREARLGGRPGRRDLGEAR